VLADTTVYALLRKGVSLARVNRRGGETLVHDQLTRPMRGVYARTLH
jgi:hypothetical protein